MTQWTDRIHEQLLVVRCQAGDDRAFEELIARCHDRLALYLRTLLGCEDLIDDVLQDTWITAYRKIGQLRDPRSLSAWLHRIARNRALMDVRGRRRRRELAEDRDPRHLPQREPELAAADRAGLYDALDRLDPAHRQVLALRYFEGMSYQEIARVIRRPIGTVRSRLHQAKCTLERELRPES